MPPPPPPPPGPPPPPAPVGGPAKVASKGGGAPDRNQLLSQIKQGAALKPTVTNDRSKPILTPSKPAATTGPAPSSSGPPKLPGNGMGPPNLGGLFAGGMPKLRPAGSAGRGPENRTNGVSAGGPKQFGGSNPSIANKNTAFQRQTSSSSTDLVDRAAPQPPVATNKPRIAPVKPNIAPKPPVPENKPTSPTVVSPPPLPNGPGAVNFSRKPNVTSVNKPPPPPASQPPPPPLPSAKPNIGRAESMRANHGKDKAPPLPPPNFNTLPRNPPPPPPPQSTPPTKTPSFARGPLPQIPNGAVPSPTRDNSRPSERPPPPPPQRMNPPMAIPPPPPAAAPPPPPPHRTAPPPQPPTTSRNGGVTNSRNVQAAPTPPQRHSSMRSNGSMTSLASATGSMNSLAGPIMDDFESRFQDRFRPVHMLPPPEPFTNCPKSYASRLALSHSAKRQQAPQPPLQYQFGNRN